MKTLVRLSVVTLALAGFGATSALSASPKQNVSVNIVGGGVPTCVPSSGKCSLDGQ